jgi:hypothetical protein
VSEIGSSAWTLKSIGVVLTRGAPTAGR